jgi:hypothetical protein
VTGFVYFICAPRSSGREAVKIGYSKFYPQKRLTDLQTGNPEKLELMGFFRGTRNLELQMHRQFCKHRISGEWFAIEGDVFHVMLDACENYYRYHC